MEKTSLKYLELHSDLQKIISEITPSSFSSIQGLSINKLNRKNNELLPAWLFVEAVEQAPIAISITNKKANIQYINQAFLDVTGYDSNELIGKNQSTVSYKKTPRHIYHDLWSTISSKKIWRGRLLNRKKNGDAYLADLTVAPMLDSNNKVSHYVAVHYDITEKYQAEKKLENQKNLIESVINASSVAMAVLDHNKRVVMDNLQYKSLVSDLNQPEPAHLFLELIATDLGDIYDYLINHPTGVQNLEICIDGGHKNEPRWFACSGKIFHEHGTHASNYFEDARHQYLLLSISDITQQKKQQQKIHLNSLRIMLSEEERIRTIRETLLGAIHQVSQPLHQIQAAINLLRQNERNSTLLDLLKQLENGCQQTVSTLDNCVPEIAPSALNPININQVLHEVLLINSTQLINNSIVIEWSPATVLPNIMGSENKLLMLFKQLIDNAIAAINNSDSHERLIKIHTIASNDNVIVYVSDSGSGIPVEQHVKVFEPFYSTPKKGRKQAGMGLVMAKEIVQQMNGFIEIIPSPQQGCCFKIAFPVIDSDNSD